MMSRSAFGVTLTVAAVILTGCSKSEASADLDGYRAGPDANQISVTFVKGPSDGPGNLEILEEDSSRVKLKVTYKRTEKDQDAIGVKQELVGTLKAPLGGRKVLNENGNEIPQVAK